MTITQCQHNREITDSLAALVTGTGSPRAWILYINRKQKVYVGYMNLDLGLTPDASDRIGYIGSHFFNNP